MIAWTIVASSQQVFHRLTDRETLLFSELLKSTGF